MAKSDGTIYIDTALDTEGINKGLSEIGSSASGLSKSAKKVGEEVNNGFSEGLGEGISKPVEEQTLSVQDRMKAFSGSMTRLGGTLSIAVTAPLTALGAKMVSSSSDLEENINKVDVAFGKSSENVKVWAETATEAFGLSKNQALEATSLFGDMGTSMGLPQEEAAKMSTSLAGLAGDLASFKNIGIDQAMTALNGIFTGETESLKTLGVVMTETNLEQFAEKTGLVYSEMSQAEKVQLRYNYVMEMTKNAQGDYARTSDGTANSMRTLSATVENLTATFGQALLPVITPVIQFITDLLTKFSELDPGVRNIIVIIGVLVAAIGPVITSIGGLLSAISTIHALLPVFSAIIGGFNPVILVIGAVVAAIALLIANWDKVKETMQKFDDFLQQIFAKDFTEIFGPVLGNALNGFFKNIENIWNSIKQIFGGIINFITGVFSGDWKKAWNGIKDIFGGVFNLLVSIIKTPINGVIALINGLVGGVAGGINLVIKALNKLSFKVPEWLKDVPLAGQFAGKEFGFNLKTMTAPQIPYLAKGAVIPPNAPFMAMLGDQKHGTNIEAPLDTIKQAVAEVIGNTRTGGGSYTFIGQINRRTLFEEVIEEAKIRQIGNGRNPFELA